MKRAVMVPPGPAWAYMLFALAIKLAAFFFFVESRSPTDLSNWKFYVIQGDGPGYIGPVENLLDRGTYVSDAGAHAERMPGFAAVYLPLRAFLSQQWALDLTLVAQVVLSAVSCYALALMALMLSGSERLFHWVYWGYALSSYVSIWDTCILTESFAASALILGSYLLLRGTSGRSRSDLAFAGLLLAWCVFLRPFMLPVLGLYAMALIKTAWDPSPRRKAVAAFMFLLPFIVVDGLWTFRNWKVDGRFVPLQALVPFNEGAPPSHGNSLRADVGDLMRAFGADHCWWNPKEPAFAFFNKDAPFDRGEFPAQLFSPDHTFGGLKELRALSLEVESGALPDSVARIKAGQLSVGLRGYLDQYKAAHPFHDLFTSRLIHLERFFLNTGVYNLPFPRFSEQTMFQKVVKGGYALLYFLVMPMGFVCCLVLFLATFDLRTWNTYIHAVPLFLALFFPFVLKAHEFRFNTLCYPFFLIATCQVVNKVWHLQPMKRLKLGHRRHGQAMG